ncbi:DUF6499 domain-containing protein [Mesorhizobium sp. B4-1-3]|uniref:transcriptional regulator domain-containing protein n=1 Tax=Mesorhizobium sp. B4-1-3 TaxID=2589889 RepID=UPI001FF0112E|nr:DUF6499 domain-containing protein [Mesorhizobium sp. B4-1-3]
MTATGSDPAVPHWQDEAAYGYTQGLTSHGWAWEFLRRNAAFRRDLAEALRHAQQCQPSGSACTQFRLVGVDLSRWGVLFCKLWRE